LGRRNAKAEIPNRKAEILNREFGWWVSDFLRKEDKHDGKHPMTYFTPSMEVVCRRGGRNRVNEREQPVGQVRGCGRRECAPRRTREEDHPGARGKLAEEGSLQPEDTRAKL
jgi:hypothetical protein